jgi:glycogen phosphorylase
MDTSLAQRTIASHVEAERFHEAARFEREQHSQPGSAAAHYGAAASAARRLLAQRWAATQAADAQRPAGHKRVHYLSMEFLMGRALRNALSALNLEGEAAQAFGPTALAQALDAEPDAALGNGGLGRLAACFLDSFATLGLPSFGYGLRYEHGMFAQSIRDGQQLEAPEDWLRAGNPWELPRHELHYRVGFGGVVHSEGGARRWVPAEEVRAQAFDFVVPGHGTQRVSTLRQWQAQALRPLDFDAFCRGDHVAAGSHRSAAEALNWVLYPDDSTANGRALRLKQEFLLVSASVQDMLARHLREAGSVDSFGQCNSLHLNDTHPALAPAELMRLLLDEHGLGWEAAWKVTQQATSYTNHTLMPEALECWPLPLFGALLPRHLEIVFEINRRLLDELAQRFPGDHALAARVSLIDETGEKRVRMASLAVAASHCVNGVSALHSQLMVDTLFADYAQLWPQRFVNVTNGVTHRRWLLQANPGLASVIDGQIGSGWRRDLTQLRRLAARAGEPLLQAQLRAVKRSNKLKLAQWLGQTQGVAVNPDSLFDVQIKRIHEYKRQLLNLLHVVARYQAIVADPNGDWVPRTVLIAGKAASAYQAAKLTIRLAHDIARVVNTDPRVGDALKLVFVPNYGVSIAERMFPAADLSEQISTAGTEASGTGNMKFALNGALTIGTWDGANIEMAQAMGEEQMFVFGLRAEGVAQLKALGYDPRLYVEQSRVLQQVLAAIGEGFFSPGEPERYRPLVQPLLQRDPYFLMADFDAYCEAQRSVDELYTEPAAWAERCALNIAGMGEFSSDRTIAQYIENIWQK